MKRRVLAESFAFALEGAAYVWRTQRNARIHAFLGYLAISLALILGVGRLERLLVVLAVTSVVVVELLNTAIEASVDIHVKGYHCLAKTAKNVAAGGVLVTAAMSVVVGLEVFGPELKRLPEAVQAWARSSPLLFYLWVSGAILFAREALRSGKGG
ncbi:MAG: diacylglycerol kinase family protein [Bacillota bacterium]